MNRRQSEEWRVKSGEGWGGDYIFYLSPKAIPLLHTPLSTLNTYLLFRQIFLQLVVIKGLANHVLIVGVEGLAVVVVAPGGPGVAVAVEHGAAAVVDFLKGLLFLGGGLGA